MAALLANLLPETAGRLFAIAAESEPPACVTGGSREQMAAFIVERYGLLQVLRFLAVEPDGLRGPGSTGTAASLWHIEAADQAGAVRQLSLRHLPWIRLDQAEPVLTLR